MSGRSDWHTLRELRLAEPHAADAYEVARLAFDLGRQVRELREQRGWNQNQLARQAGMTQSAVARFEAGGTIPTLPVLGRLAHALDVELDVRLTPKPAPPNDATISTATAGRLERDLGDATNCGPTG